MPIDEQARHRMYRKLDELMGSKEATTLMEHLPPVGWADVATKRDLQVLRLELKQDVEILRHDLRGEMESLARRVIMWTSSMVLATAALAFAAGRFV